MPSTVGNNQTATFTVPVNGTTADATQVLGNDNTVRAAINSHDADPLIHWQSSIDSARPVAGVAGRVWMNTDTLVIKYDNGSSWVLPNTDIYDAGLLQYSIRSDVSASYQAYSYSDTYNSGLGCSRARGTKAAPAVVQANDVVGSFAVYGYCNTGPYNFGTQPVASIRIYATELYSATTTGSKMEFQINPNGTHGDVARMWLDQNGGLTVGSTYLAPPQYGLALAYDGSNYLKVSVASTGAVTYDATGAFASHTFNDIVGITAGSGSPALEARTTGAVQGKFSYDGSNYLTIASSSAGAITYDATGASASHTFADRVTVSSELRVGGDVGGAASHNTITNVSDVTANSTGVGSIKFKGATSRDSTGFIKIYIGTTPYYIPVFSAITG